MRYILAVFGKVLPHFEVVEEEDKSIGHSRSDLNSFLYPNRILLLIPTFFHTFAFPFF